MPSIGSGRREAGLQYMHPASRASVYGVLMGGRRQAVVEVGLHGREGGSPVTRQAGSSVGKMCLMMGGRGESQQQCEWIFQCHFACQCDCQVGMPKSYARSYYMQAACAVHCWGAQP